MPDPETGSAPVYISGRTRFRPGGEGAVSHDLILTRPEPGGKSAAHLIRHRRVNSEGAHILNKGINDPLGGRLGDAHLVVSDAAEDAVARALRRPTDDGAQSLRDRVGRVRRAVQLVVGDLRVRDSCGRAGGTERRTRHRKTRVRPLLSSQTVSLVRRKLKRRTFKPSPDAAPPFPAPARATPPRRPNNRRRRPRRQPLPERNVAHLNGRLVHVNRSDRFLRSSSSSS